MAYIKIDCPHCHTKNVSAFSVAQHALTNNQDLYNVFFCCNHCEGGIIALVEQLASDYTPHEYPNDLGNYDYLSIKTVWPVDQGALIPEYLPENIKMFFREAAENLTQGKNDSAGMMCRRILDVATKKLSTKHHWRLIDRIDGLAAEGLLTSDLKDWAHEIRLMGNEVTHEDEPITNIDAKEIFKFTELFLMYTFTLPGMLKDRKAEKT